MKPGQASKTAALVCMGRAIAHGRTPVARFSDPIAIELLPDDARRRVEAVRAGEEPKGLRARILRGYHERQSQLMVARTVGIDDVVREAGSKQVVILGAGLDGRAWRMTELKDAVVFEVDHPDSQREKRAKVARLTPTAREIRFVGVDFERDDLAAALEAAGHDRSLPTTWIWEGVVMYLRLSSIEATLRILAARSAPGSRLVVNYHRPAPMLILVGLVLRFIGEPLRSRFTPAAMRALLERHGFAVTWDASLAELGARMDPAVGEALRKFGHIALASATRG